MISAIVLAAGKSARMGQNKLLINLAGKPLIKWVLDAVLASAIEEVVVVTGRDGERVAQCFADGAVRRVHNCHYQSGQGSSIAAGVKALSAASRYCFFIMGDQPFVDSNLINAMIADFRDGEILQPVCRGVPGAPVAFAARYYKELSELSGDIGGKLVIENNRTHLRQFYWSGALQFIDIDNPADFERAKIQLLLGDV